MTPTSQSLLTRSLLGALLVLFLLPFTTLTCGGRPLTTLNGAQLATGTTLSNKESFTGRVKEETLKPEPLAALAILAAIAGLGLAFLKPGSRRIPTAVAAFLCGACLLALKLKVDQDVMRRGEGVIGIQWEPGYWLALLVALGTGVVSLLSTRPGDEKGA